MKWLFALLVLANLAFWGFTRVDVPPPALDPKSLEVNAAKLTLVPVEVPKPPANLPVAADATTPPDAAKAEVADATPTDIVKLTDKPVDQADDKAEAKGDKKQDTKKDGKGDSKVDAPKAELVCFAWHGILTDDVPNVRKKVAALKLGGDTHLQAPDGDAKVRYWVYIPPRASTAEAQKKGDELKALGVTDYFVVNDGGKWQNAVSLGLFANKDSAERRLAAIKDQGVRSAQMQERSEGNAGSTLLLRKVPKSAKQALEKAAQGFRGSAVSESAC
jgi:hypothetical protein